MSLSYRQYLQRMNQNPGPLDRSGGLNKSGGLLNNYKITSPPSAFSKKPVVQQKPIKQDVKMEPENKQDESPLPDKPPLEQKSVLPNKKSPLPDIKILNQNGGLIKTEKGKARRKKVMNKIDSSFKDDDGIDDEETEKLVEGTIDGVERHMTLYSELSDQTEKGDATKINELLVSIETAEKENNEKIDKIAEKYAEGKMTTKTLKKVLAYIHEDPKQMKKHFKGLRSDYKKLQSSKKTKTQTSVSAPQSSNATPEKEPKARRVVRQNIFKSSDPNNPGVVADPNDAKYEPSSQSYTTEFKTEDELNTYLESFTTNKQIQNYVNYLNDNLYNMQIKTGLATEGKTVLETFKKRIRNAYASINKDNLNNFVSDETNRTTYRAYINKYGEKSQAEKMNAKTTLTGLLDDKTFSYQSIMDTLNNINNDKNLTTQNKIDKIRPIKQQLQIMYGAINFTGASQTTNKNISDFIFKTGTFFREHEKNEKKQANPKGNKVFEQTEKPNQASSNIHTLPVADIEVVGTGKQSKKK